MGLYENVKAMCDKSSTSVLALEIKLGFPRSSICKWNENTPSVAKVRKVADELGTTVDALTQGVEFPDKRKKTI